MPGMSYLKIGEHADVKISTNVNKKLLPYFVLANQQCKSQKLTSDKRHYRVGKVTLPLKKSWKNGAFCGIPKAITLFFEAQQKIEEAFDDEDLTSYQKANLAYANVDVSGNTNVNRQLAIKLQDFRFKDDNWFR